MQKGNQMKARDLARHKWHEILPRFDIAPEFLRNRHGPCPLCGGTDRFRFDNKDGYGSYFCAACGSGEGFTLIMKKHIWTYHEAAKAVEGAINRYKITAKIDKTDKANADDLFHRMVELWRRSKPIAESSIVKMYLLSRNVYYDNPQVMRFVKEDGATILLCKVSDQKGNGCQIHRTYLDNDGAKTHRKLMRGAYPSGSAIRLHQPLDGVMGVAEGLETALSAYKQFGIPTWSLLNANNMVDFVPPNNVSELTIFGDNDESFTGQAAAYQLAHRIKKTGIKVAVLIPRVAGTDWNDYPLQKHI
jgi:putative DNA primase/helicase